MCPKLLLVILFTLVSLTQQQTYSSSTTGTGGGTGGGTTGGGTGGGTGATVQACTPFSCPSIIKENLPNDKLGQAYKLNIGLLQSSTIYNPNSVALANFAAYTLNNYYPDLNVSIQMYPLFNFLI